MRQTLQIVAGWNAREIEKGEKVVHSDFACPTPYLELALSASYLVTHWLHLLLTLFQFGFICLTCCPLLALPALHLISNWLYLPHTLFRLVLSASYLVTDWLCLPLTFFRVGFFYLTYCPGLNFSAHYQGSFWLFQSHNRFQSGFVCFTICHELSFICLTSLLEITFCASKLSWG